MLGLELVQVSGTEDDRLQVSSSATLDGTMNVPALSGFFASVDDDLPALTFDSRPGGFATTNLPTLSGGLYLDPVYNSLAWDLIVRS